MISRAQEPYSPGATIATLTIMTFSITTISIMGLFETLSLTATSAVMISIAINVSLLLLSH